jgi:LmbE family N-acetylglucosaminyl deacetylase
MTFAVGKKVLVVTAHQDDESLFCGGLLCSLRGQSDVTVICMSAAKQPRDVEGRNRFFENACQTVGARPFTTDFRDARHVWSSPDLFFRDRPDQVAAMRDYLRAKFASVRPDVVVTHNENGEYGHCYHRVVHRICCQAFPREKLRFIGIGSKSASNRLVVQYDANEKKRLMDCYPTFNATRFSLRFFGEVITYQPETYVSCDGVSAPPEATRLGVTTELAGDFMHFWVRKLRDKVAWY